MIAEPNVGGLTRTQGGAERYPGKNERGADENGELAPHSGQGERFGLSGARRAAWANAAPFPEGVLIGVVQAASWGSKQVATASIPSIQHEVRLNGRIQLQTAGCSMLQGHLVSRCKNNKLAVERGQRSVFDGGQQVFESELGRRSPLSSAEKLEK